MIASFVICLLIFVIIGTLSTLKNKHNNSDYLLASHSVKPWLVGLSAVATNNSGYMFIGMVGYTYIYGFSSIWLMFGWIFGDLVASLLIHKKLRISSEEQGVLSFAGAISKWGGLDHRKLRAYLGLITIIFLGTYAAAQLAAGSKALNVLLGWSYEAGAIIGALIVLIYCFAGGIRASIWTDAAQSFVMIFAMGLLCVVAVGEVGGVSDLITKSANVSGEYTNLFPQNLPLGPYVGPLMFVAGWIFTGFGVAGQPHIMVRFMAMDDPNNINRVRAYYYSFYTLFYIMTILVGIAARILLPDIIGLDPELALPVLSMSLLPEVLVGIILAGIFAATMSTADSQILSCTAAITRDFSQKKPSYLMTKLATVFITFVALFIALYGTNNVFSLVLIAWSALASSFVPLLLIHIFGGKISEKLAITVAISGIVSMLVWRHFGLDEYIYETTPGMAFGLITYFLLRPIMSESHD